MTFKPVLVILTIAALNNQTKIADGLKKWRGDSRCGENYRLSNGAVAQCDPQSDTPCCSEDGWCGNTKKHCECKPCIHYKEASDGQPKLLAKDRLKRSPKKSSKLRKKQRPKRKPKRPSKHLSRRPSRRQPRKPPKRPSNRKDKDRRKGVTRLQVNRKLTGGSNKPTGNKLAPTVEPTKEQAQNPFTYTIMQIAGILYVDETVGSTEALCGSRETPCKYLQHAVNKSTQGGKVILHGNHTATAQIELTKSMSIVGRSGATIKGNTFHGAVFKLSRTQGPLHLTNVKFNGLAIISIHSKAAVVVENCSVIHSTKPTGKVVDQTVMYIHRYGERYTGWTTEGPIFQLAHEAMGMDLKVIRSSFTGSQQRYIIKTAFRSSLSTSIRFEDCSFKDSLGMYLSETENVVLLIKNCTFNRITCSAIEMMSQIGFGPSFLLVEKSSFINGVGCLRTLAFTSGGAISTLGISSVNMSDCEFRNLTTGRDYKDRWRGGDGGAVCVSVFGSDCKTFVVIKKCVFDGNHAYGQGGDVYIESVATAILEDFTFSKSRSYRDGGSVYAAPQKDIVFANCIFTYNGAEEKGGAVSLIEGAARFVFESCIFRGNKAGQNGGGIALKMKLFSKVKTGKTDKIIHIRSCEFDMNSGNLGGAIYNTARIQSLIQSSMFINNKALTGGGVYAGSNLCDTCKRNNLNTQRIRSYFIAIRNCQFRNNSATSLGQSIYSTDGIQVEDTVINATEKYIAPHLSLEKGDISLSNISMHLHRDSKYPLASNSKGIVLKSDDIMLKRGLNFICPTNFNVDEMKNASEVFTRVNLIRRMASKDTKETTYKFFSVDCRACPYASYTLHNGRLYLPELSTKVPPENNVTIQQWKCAPCPTGATCEVSVRAVDNFWGYKNDFKLGFLICPRAFCCGSETVRCSSFDTCAPGRKGTLCGTCAEGYKQNFVGADCIPKGEACDVQVFVTYFVLYTVFYTIFFVFITNAEDIVILLKGIMLKKQPVSGLEEAETGNQMPEREMMNKEQAKVLEEAETGNPLPIAGFVQIVILFFQVAGLLQVKFMAGEQSNNSSFSKGLRESITEIFYFRFVIYQQVCPSDDMTFLEKEMILFGMKLVTLFNLLLLFIVYAIVKALLSCLTSPSPPTIAAPSENVSMELRTDRSMREAENETFDLPKDVLTTLSFISMLKCTSIKLLKLYYSPIIKSALMMVHCVTVVDKRYLYFYGDHECYNAWQIGIMLIVLPSILMFPLCFEMALRFLKDRQISSSQFVLAAACPFYAVFLYVWRSIHSSRKTNIASTSFCSKDEELFRQAILQGEELLFNEVEGRSLGWQVVQLYRTFSITALNTFLVNPIYRQLAYIVLLVVFVIHDQSRKPYKHPYLNVLQSLSSTCLIFVLVCNIIPAVSYLVNVQTVPSIHEVVKVLGVIELMVYAAVPLSFPVWKLKTHMDNKRKAKDE